MSSSLSNYLRIMSGAPFQTSTLSRRFRRTEGRTKLAAFGFYQISKRGNLFSYPTTRQYYYYSLYPRSRFCRSHATGRGTYTTDWGYLLIPCRGTYLTNGSSMRNGQVPTCPLIPFSPKIWQMSSVFTCGSEMVKHYHLSSKFKFLKMLVHTQSTYYIVMGKQQCYFSSCLFYYKVLFIY